MLYTETSRDYVRSILLELPKLVPRTTVPLIILIIKFDNYQIVGV